MTAYTDTRAADLVHPVAGASSQPSTAPTAKHTPGPWRWEFNAEHKRVHLVGGRPRFDLTVMDFDRWGMNRATVSFRDTSEDGMNLMFKLHERTDWIAPEAGREHHKSWHQLVTHPDARLMAAAPELLGHLRFAVKLLGAIPAISGTAQVDAMRAAIANATGEAA